MRERSEMILKIVCGVLVGLLLVQLTRLGLRTNPLRGVRLPELPTLPASLEAPPAAPATNIVTRPGPSPNTPTTNALPSPTSGGTATNAAPAPTPAKLETNVPGNSTGPGGTNSAPSQAPEKAETNSVSGQTSDKVPTNVAAGKNGPNVGSARAPGKPGPQPLQAQSSPAKMPELSPLIQARIDKIVQSEILAPFMRPMPMALLGIAGQDAFLRAPNGQTGLLKAGDELAGIKLIRIGINRVLVEQAGEPKELTIFSGLGGESLLPQPKPATNETTIKSK